MNSPSLVIILWLKLGFWFLATSAWQIQNGIENWGSTPRIWHASKANLYQRPFYGPTHEAQTTTTAVPLQNGIGNRYNGRQNWNTPRSNLYQTPFIGPKHEVKTPARAVRLRNGIGNGRNVPSNWNTPKTNTHQRSFYIPNYRVEKTTSQSQFQNGLGNGRDLPQYRNFPKANLYQRPFYGPEYKVKTTARAVQLRNGIGNGRKFPPNWNTPKTNLHQRPFYGPNNRIGKTTSPSWIHSVLGNGRNAHQNWKSPKANLYHGQFYGPTHEAHTTTRTVRLKNSIGYGRDVPRSWNAPNTKLNQKPFYGPNQRIEKTTSPSGQQNGIAKRRNFPRNWIPAKSDLYQVPLYGGNDEVEKTLLDGPMIMRSNVESAPFGIRIGPRIAKWLPTVQRNQIPQTREVMRSPVRAFVATPEIDSRTTGLIEPGATSNYQLHDYAIGRKLEPVPSQNTGDVYNTGDVALQTVLSKMRPSESDLIPESVSNQRATSRTGYIATAMEERQRPVPRKSYVTTSYTKKEIRLNDPKLIKLRQILPNLKKRSLNRMNVEDVSGTVARRNVSNVARNFDKRHSIEKKSAIRKVKGRQNWGILNEFTPSVRLANMILLKQKRQDIRKRELNQFETKEGKRTPKTAAHNRGMQNVSASKNQNVSEAFPPSWTKHNVSLKLHHVPKSQGLPKRHKKKSARNFINGRNNGFFVRPSNTYLNRQFVPFDDMADGRKYEPYISTREQFQAAQMAMAERMRAMRSRGLFHSLGNINPQFFSRNPFRYPAMPMPQQFVAMQLHGMTPRNFPFQYGRTPFAQTQDYVGTPWNIRLANKMRGTEEDQSSNVGIMPQDSYKQGSVQPNMEQSKSPDPSSQMDSGKFADGFYQSPVTEQSSQILKIGDDKLFEGHPMVNSENNDAGNDQEVYGKTSPRLTGLQVTDQSAAMLNKWYPVRTGKVSLMPDPRKYSAQWPSRLPGLDVATKFNQLQARGYSAINNPAIFNRFYQGNEKSLRPKFYDEENENNIPSDWNNIDSSNVAFNRGYQLPFPVRQFMMQRSGMNGIASEGYFPNLVPYTTFPFPTFPNYGRRKREVRQEKNSSKVTHAKENVSDGPLSDGKNKSHKISTLPSENYKMNNARKLGETHSNKTKIHSKKALISKHSSRTRKKEKERSTRNFVNAGNYFMYARTPPSTSFFAVATDPRMRLMYPQSSVEDPINDIERKGYSVASGPFGAGFPGLLSQGPLQYTAAGPPQPTQRIQELAFPVGPPQSLMELSQKVDQFPAQEFLSSGRDVSPETQREVSDVNDDDLSASKPREDQPKSVSAALNLFSREPLNSSEWPTMRKPRGGPNAENESEQTVSSPPSYSFGMSGVPQSIQGPPERYVPEFPEQSSSEFSEEDTQDMPENEPQENGQGLSEGGETYVQADNALDDGAEDGPGEAEPDLTPGLFDGLDNAQTSLLQQHMGNFAPMKGKFGVGNFHTFRPYQKGEKRLPSENHLSPSDRQKALLRQNAMARQKALLQQRATFSTKENIQGNVQGNILGGTASGRNSHMLSLPNLSLNTIEKLIDSEAGEESKADYNTGAVHGYSSNRKGSAGNKISNEDLNVQDSPEHTGVSDWNVHNSLSGTGKIVHNFDWKSPLMSQSQSPSDFNWKLERALTQWKEPANPNHDPANSGGTLPDSPPEKVLVPPKGSNGNPDVVPGYTFDTQGQRSGPLFLPNPPPELGDDSSAETVLMVPGSGNKLKGEVGAKKETISKKRNQRKNKTT